jgi:hypothetical protein
LKPSCSERLESSNFKEATDNLIAKCSNDQVKTLETSENVSSFVSTLKKFQLKLNDLI